MMMIFPCCFLFFCNVTYYYCKNFVGVVVVPKLLLLMHAYIA